MTVPGNIDALLLGGLGGYQIERSLRFNSADSAYLELTTGGTAGNQTTWTFSCWVKRSKLGTAQYLFNPSVGGDSTNESIFQFNTSDKIRIYDSGATRGDFVTTQVFRDTSAWYHIVVALDTTQGTSTNRFKLYVNGVQITTFDTASYPGSSVTWGWNRASTRHRIGAYAFPSTASNFGDFYLTEIHHIDGQALTPSSFGETDTITGVWKPKKYSGSGYGTNGFYLKFADNSGTTSTTLGKDSSGNSNNWTPNNFSVTAGSGNDSMIDTPTPYADRGNYCTLNPITSNATGYLISPINGNLDASLAAGSNAFFGVAGTQAITSGKFYWEVTPTTIDTNAGTWMEVGIIQSALAYPAGTSIGAYNGGFAYTNDGYKARSGSYSAYGATWTANDVIGVALDADNGSITFYKNGVSQGAAYTDLASYNLPAGYYPAIAIYRSTGTSQYAVFNFGQRAFSYTPPAGFSALNTQNLPEPTIKKPSTYFEATAYSGTAGSQAITGLGFSPDLVWIKRRNSTNSHVLQDAVRGAGKTLFSNATNAESGNSGDLITSFDSAGFTVNDTYLGGSGGGGTNASGGTYVAWCWDESATPGFDIVTYTGTGSATTVAHSLGVAPSMMIVKRRNTADNWAVYHSSLGNTQVLYLESTAAAATASTFWNNTTPTSSVFSVGTSGSVNANGGTYVAYLWSEVAGFSKFGSYTGNGSTDGPFVFCGFRPRWVLAKRSDASAYNWFIFDAARSPENVSDEWLLPNGSNAEQAQVVADMVSNGFKIRSSLSEFNINGGTYIFAAFAESPFKYSLAR